MSGWPDIVSQNEAWTHLDTQVLGSSAASITFSGIAASAAPRLRLYLYVVNDGASAEFVDIQFNNDSAGNYAFQRLHASTTTISAARSTAQTAIRVLGGGSLATSENAVIVVDIAKPVAGEVGRTVSKASFMASAAGILFETDAGEWTNTGALINRVDILATTDFDTGTRAVLEGAA